MDLPTLKREYAYELKESFYRRAIACAIDSAIIGLIVFFFGGFIVAGITNSNPMGIFFGLAGDLVMKNKSEIPMTPLFASMFGFAAVYFVVSSLYYGIFESGSRKTAGKAIMHLEIGSYMRDPNFFIAIGRNLTKILGGSIGGYILGILGANIGAAIAVYMDYTLSPGSKVDVRQRASEKAFGTMVLTENDENDIGAFSVDGAPTVEEALKGTFEKKKKVMKPAPAASSVPSKGLGKASSQEPEKAEAEKERPSFGRSMAGPLSNEKEAPKGSEGGAPEPVPVARSAPKPMDEAKPPIPTPPSAPGGKNEARDRIVLSFMMDFDIDETRAQLLYDTGYRKREDLSDAIPADLIMLKGINPTIARRIISKAKEV
jgi:hypothetical protein